MADADIDTSIPHSPEPYSKDVGMGTFVLALTLGILARAYLSSVVRLPYTCLVLLFGLAYGFIIYTEVGITGGDIFSTSSDLWINLSPEAILNVILPILIFGSSFSSDLHLFLQQLTPVLTLAGPAVLVNTALLALTAKYILPYGWDWMTSFMVGSMLSATDPVRCVLLALPFVFSHGYSFPLPSLFSGILPSPPFALASAPLLFLEPSHHTRTRTRTGRSGGNFERLGSS